MNSLQNIVKDKVRLPTKSNDVIVYVSPSLACSGPLDTRYPDELISSLEENGGSTS